MKTKIFIPIIVGAVITPQIAFAAWWNPFSWFDNWSFLNGGQNKTEILENKIQELEKKLSNATTSTTTTTQTSTTPPTIKGNIIPSNTGSVVSQTKPTIIINRDVLYADIVKKYTDFQLYITNEKKGLNQDSSLPTERAYYAYLNNLLNIVASNLGYLITIKNLNPRPVVEEIYLSKFNKLKSEYDIEAKQYATGWEQDVKNTATAEEQAAKEAVNQALLARQQYAQKIKVKIAEMDQLDVQIDTLAGQSLMDILNTAKQLDGNLLFYTFKYKCYYGNDCTFTYPYDSKSYDNNYYASSIRAGFKAIVANYRAFLNVELAKNQ